MSSLFIFLLLQGEKNCLHIFRTDIMPAERNWTPTAWREAIIASPFRLPESPRLRSLIEWHYRMSVINSWGSLGLRQLVKADFSDAGDDEVAEILSLGCWFTPSSSPAVYPCQSNGDCESDNGPGYEGAINGLF